MPDVLLWRNTHQTILKFFDPAVPDFHCKKSQTAGSGSESFSYHTGFHLSLKPLCCFRLKSKHRDLPICYKNKRCGIVPLRKPEIFMLFCIITRLSEKRKVKLAFAHFKLYFQRQHDMQDPLFIEIIGYRFKPEFFIKPDCIFLCIHDNFLTFHIFFDRL